MDDYSLPAKATYDRNSNTKFTVSNKQSKNQHGAESGLSGTSLLSISLVGMGLVAGFVGSIFLLSQILQPVYTDLPIAVQLSGNVTNLTDSPTTKFSTQFFQEAAKLDDIGTVEDTGKRWQFDSESPHSQKIEKRLNLLFMNHQGYTNQGYTNFGATTSSFSFR